MQLQIHFIGKRKFVASVYALPSAFEGVVALPAAFSAWSMSSGERNGFIQEKQLRIAIWGHHYAVPIPKFKNARDPPHALVAADDFPIGVMHCTASVAHDCAASRSPKNVSERVYSVLQWHS